MGTYKTVENPQLHHEDFYFSHGDPLSHLVSSDRVRSTPGVPAGASFLLGPAVTAAKLPGAAGQHPCRGHVAAPADSAALPGQHLGWWTTDSNYQDFTRSSVAASSVDPDPDPAPGFTPT